MDLKDDETASTSFAFEGTPGKWNARSKRLLKKKISLAFLLKVICSSQESCIDWLKSKNLLPKAIFCPDCGKKMKFEVHDTSVDNYIWICKECRIEPPSYSIRHGSWLENRDAPLVDILLFTYLWTNGFSDVQIAKETNMPIDIVKSWDKVYSDICTTLQRKAKEEEDGEDEPTIKINPRETPKNIWRKKNKFKDPFLEFLKEAESL